jgi:hypothetical protein
MDYQQRLAKMRRQRRLRLLYNALIYWGLALGLAAGALAIIVYYQLGIQGNIISPDEWNITELVMSCIATSVILAAWVAHFIKMFRR